MKLVKREISASKSNEKLQIKKRNVSGKPEL